LNTGILKACADYFALRLCRKAAAQGKRGKTGKDQSIGLQSGDVLGSQSMVRAGAGINSFLQKGQKAVATLLSSMMDSDLKDISKRVEPG